MTGKRTFTWISLLQIGGFLAGCQTGIGEAVKKQLDATAQGISYSTDGVSSMLSPVCEGIIKVSDDADEVLRLKSSEDLTNFYVDGIRLTKYPVKQLKVCINGNANHTVVAEPEGCEPKTEKLEPPYDDPIYEFQFMLGECK